MWLSTGVLALALMISSWTVMFAAAKSQGEEPLIVPLVGWMIAGSALYATFATSLLPWGTNLAPALNTLAWAAGFHAGVPVAAVSAYLWPDFRRPARQTRG